MPLRRTRLTLSVERELPDGAGGLERVRLSAELEPSEGSSAEEVGAEQLRDALGRLREELGRALGAPAGRSPGTPRSLEELIETYRPRQTELIDLLRAEGEISEPEAQLMRSHLSGEASPPPAEARPEPAPLPPPHDRPLAAMPLANDHTPSTPRPIPRLLQEYRIETLKQAGAVRARRQISYEEYMALKRHFAALEAGTAAAGKLPPPPDAPPTGTGS